MTSPFQGKAGVKGGLLWEISRFVLPLHLPTPRAAGGSFPKLPTEETLPTKPLGDPMDSPTLTEGLRSVTSSASFPGGYQSHQHHFCVMCDNICSATIRHFLE